jgi:hypothetical protein
MTKKTGDWWLDATPEERARIDAELKRQYHKAEGALAYYERCGKPRYPRTLRSVIWRNLLYGPRRAPREVDAEYQVRRKLGKGMELSLALFVIAATVAGVIGFLTMWWVGTLSFPLVAILLFIALKGFGGLHELWRLWSNGRNEVNE